MQYWKSRGPLSFVAHLGNALSATNETGQQWPALRSFDEARRCGNDCAVAPDAGRARPGCFGASQLAASVFAVPRGRRTVLRLRPPPAGGARPRLVRRLAPRARARPDAHMAARPAAGEPQPAGRAGPLAGLEGEARRWGPSGGGLGAVQLSWFGAQLEAASRGSGA